MWGKSTKLQTLVNGESPLDARDISSGSLKSENWTDITSEHIIGPIFVEGKSTAEIDLRGCVFKSAEWWGCI